MVVVYDVVFGQADGAPLMLDVYAPSEVGSYPAVIAIHGGGWRRGDKRRWETSAPDLVSAGFVVFSVNYRLAVPGYPTFRAARRDVRRSVSWVRNRGAEYGADPAAISLLGSSAGGHLALLVGQRQTYPNIRAVAAWSPPLNLRRLVERGILPNALRDFLGCSVDECPGRYASMSPSQRIGTSDPPTFIANSTEEIIPLHQVRWASRRLDSFRVANTWLSIPGDAHAQQLRPVVLDDTISFLRDHGTSE